MRRFVRVVRACVRAAHVFLFTAKITRARSPRERKIRGAVPAKSAATFHITHTHTPAITPISLPCEFFLSLSVSARHTGESPSFLYSVIETRPALLIIKNKLRSIRGFLSRETIIFSKKKKKMTREEISSIGNKFSLFPSSLSTN